jgi:hypothetical protein
LVPVERTEQTHFRPPGGVAERARIGHTRRGRCLGGSRLQ